MTKQLVSSFYVAGLSARTNNAYESTGQGRIPEIWAQFLQSPPVISNIMGSAIYAVYTDYESDQTGEYTFLVGYKRSSVENLKSDLTSVQIPEGEFRVITSELGPVNQVVPAVWQHIWNMSPDELQGHRAFKTDFEVYDDRAKNPKLAQVDVFPGLR